jgi:hypothetical protein
VLRDDSLYDPARFKAVPLSPAARVFVQDSPPAHEAFPNQSLLLNRLLLEDTYPAELARSAHPLRVALATDLSAILTRAPLDHGGASPVLSQPAPGQPHGAKLARINRRFVEDAFPSEIALNRLGVPGSVNPYYVAILLFITLLSIGESIYSPRLYEYAASIAPQGQEASYMSLSYLPFFLAKLPVALCSGVLLTAFCPETGPRSPATLWLIIGMTTLVAPVGLFTLRRWIQVPEAGRV